MIEQCIKNRIITYYIRLVLGTPSMTFIFSKNNLMYVFICIIEV